MLVDNMGLVRLHARLIHVLLQNHEIAKWTSRVQNITARARSVARTNDNSCESNVK